MADPFSTDQPFCFHQSIRDSSTSQWIEQNHRIGCVFSAVEFSPWENQQLSSMVENRTGNRVGIIIGWFSPLSNMDAWFNGGTPIHLVYAVAMCGNCIKAPRSALVWHMDSFYEAVSRTDTGAHHQPCLCIDYFIDHRLVRSIRYP
jgi:hypothetical protein